VSRLIKPFTLALSVGLLLAVSSCKKEVEPETSGAPAPKSVKDKFVGALAQIEFINYDVPIGGGGSLTYTTLHFAEDGTWIGDASLELADEPFDCEESGVWEIVDNGPIDAVTARMMMKMEETDCPGRSSPQQKKIEIRLHGQHDRPQIVDL